LLVGLTAPLFAGEIALYAGPNDRPKVNAKWTPDKLNVSVDNGYFFTIAAPACGYSVAERETIANQRITEALSVDPLAPVTICKIRSAPTIWVGRVRIITVYEQDAAAAKVPQDELARQWAAHIATTMKKVAPTDFVLGPSTYKVAVGGIFLFRLADKDGYGRVWDRGKELERRIDDLLSGHKLPCLTTETRGADTSILANGKLLVTATVADAVNNNADGSAALAATWIKTLQAAWPKMAPK
jgi:hypothetical protein